MLFLATVFIISSMPLKIVLQKYPLPRMQFHKQTRSLLITHMTSENNPMQLTCC